MFKCVSFWLYGCCGEWEGGPVNQVNHTSWLYRPKSVCNRCLIDLFCGVVWVVTLPFWHFCWCRGFCHRTGSDPLLFVSQLVRSTRPYTYVFHSKILHIDSKVSILLHIYMKQVTKTFGKFYYMVCVATGTNYRYYLYTCLTITNRETFHGNRKSVCEAKKDALTNVIHVINFKSYDSMRYYMFESQTVHKKAKEKYRGVFEIQIRLTPIVRYLHFAVG